MRHVLAVVAAGFSAGGPLYRRVEAPAPLKGCLSRDGRLKHAMIAGRYPSLRLPTDLKRSLLVAGAAAALIMIRRIAKCGLTLS